MIPRYDSGIIGGIVGAVLIIPIATIILSSIFCNLYHCTVKIKMFFKKPEPIQ